MCSDNGFLMILWNKNNDTDLQRCNISQRVEDSFKV